MSISQEIVQLIQKNKKYSQFTKDLSKHGYHPVSKQTFYNHKNQHLDEIHQSRYKHTSILKDLHDVNIDQNNNRALCVDINGESKEDFWFLKQEERIMDYCDFITDFMYDKSNQDIFDTDMEYIDKIDLIEGKMGLKIIVNTSKYQLDTYKIKDSIAVSHLGNRMKKIISFLNQMEKEKKIQDFVKIEQERKYYYVPYENIIEIKVEDNQDVDSEMTLSIYDYYSSYEEDELMGCYRNNRTISNIRIPIS